MSLLSLMHDCNLNQLTNGLSNFTVDFYQQSTSENVIFSPLSILSALALLSQACNGKTFEQLRKGLYLNEDKTVTANQFFEYNELLENSKGESILSIANRINVKEGHSLNKNFQEVAVKFFSSGIECVNFANNVEAAQSINSFVERKTHNKIKDLISPDMLDKDTRVLLTNAIYFNGNWQYKFDAALTEKSDFYISETETVPVDFMHIESDFDLVFSHELGANILEMKYAASKFVFIIVLPVNRMGLSAVESKLKNFDLTKITNQFGDSDGVEVIIPKFKVEFAINLNEVLMNLGIDEIFDKQKADLGGLSENYEQLYVSNVMHKAFIEINEEGSEAAAATSIVGMQKDSLDSEPLPPPQFRADHPFLYYIWDTESETPVFIGRVTKFN